MRRLLVVVLIAFGCAPQPPAPLSPMILDPVIPGEYSTYDTNGSGILTGQAFLTTRGGDVKVAAGRQVTLDPATSYARQWNYQYGGELARFSEVPPAPEFSRHRRVTIADGSGRFRFTDLPVGNYIVRSEVTWETGAVDTGLQGGVVSELAEVVSNKPTEVILSTVRGPGLGVSFVLPILTRDELWGKSFRKIRTFSGISCARERGQQASESEARTDLSDQARKQSADALTNVVCAKGGFTVTKNCFSYVECKGDALAWK